MNNQMNLVAGLDIGNGYVKGLTMGTGDDSKGIDLCSSVARVTDSSNIKKEGAAIPGFMKDLLNNMDVKFDSPLVKNGDRWLFGARGLASGKDAKEFDVNGMMSKAQQELSAILVLGCAAGRALEDYYEVNNTLPTDILNVHIFAALALPIDEYRDYREMYAEGFKKDSHIVSFCDFEPMVRVRLFFDDVRVLPEGGSANYAITEMGREFVDHMLDDAKKMNPRLGGVTSEQILRATNTLGIDIGEGTVNFPVFVDGEFNPDVSMTLDKGYGNVLRNALTALRKAKQPFPSRKTLANFLVKGPNEWNGAKYNLVKEIVDREIDGFVEMVRYTLSDMLDKTSAYTQVIYVYGGGSGPVRDKLYPVLLEAAESFGGLPVFYLDATYSRKLNREGLFIVADAQAQAAGFIPGMC